METEASTCQHGTLFTEWCSACAKQLEYYNKMDNVAKLVPGKTDQEIHDDIKRRVIECYEPLLKLCDEANNHGFIVNVGIGPNAFGKFTIINCQIMKVFK